MVFTRSLLNTDLKVLLRTRLSSLKSPVETKVQPSGETDVFSSGTKDSAKTTKSDGEPKTLHSFPQKMNLFWTGGKMPLRYKQFVWRIGQGSGNGVTSTKTNLFVDDIAEFERDWRRTAAGMSDYKAGDEVVPHLGSPIDRYDLAIPIDHDVNLKSFDELPEETPGDRLLGHIARTDRMVEGRNKAIAAGDIRKVQIGDAEGGITINIRSAMPAEQCWTTEERLNALKKRKGVTIEENPTNGSFKMSKAQAPPPPPHWRSKTKVDEPEPEPLRLYPIPNKNGSIPPSEYPFLAILDSGLEDMFITVPNSEPTKRMKASLVERQIKAMTTKFSSFETAYAEKRKPNTAVNFDILETCQHPLQYQQLSHSTKNQRKWSRFLLKLQIKTGFFRKFPTEKMPKITWYTAERLPDSGFHIIKHESPDAINFESPQAPIHSTQVVSRTGNVIHDMRIPYSKNEKSEIAKQAKAIKRAVLEETVEPKCEGKWNEVFPTQFAQDDSDIRYSDKGYPSQHKRKKKWV